MIRRRAFTLVELLVVIGIIMMLIAVLFPVLKRARDQSESAQCKSNLRQLYLAETFFADDNAGHYTSVKFQGWEQTWMYRMQRYISKDESTIKRPYHCPSVPVEHQMPLFASYGINPCVMMPNWLTRRDKKIDDTEIILMG